MKKRMFLTTILMTLVLLVAVTTATFAWYSASQGAAAQKVVDDKVEVNTADNSYAQSGLKFTVVLSAPSATGLDLTNNKGETWYYVGTKLVQDKAQDLVPYGSFTVTVKVELVGGAGGATLAEVLAGQQFSHTIAISANNADVRLTTVESEKFTVKAGQDIADALSFTQADFDAEGNCVKTVTVYYSIQGKGVDGEVTEQKPGDYAGVVITGDITTIS